MSHDEKVLNVRNGILNFIARDDNKDLCEQLWAAAHLLHSGAETEAIRATIALRKSIHERIPGGVEKWLRWEVHPKALLYVGIERLVQIFASHLADKEK